MSKSWLAIILASISAGTAMWFRKWLGIVLVMVVASLLFKGDFINYIHESQAREDARIEKQEKTDKAAAEQKQEQLRAARAQAELRAAEAKVEADKLELTLADKKIAEATAAAEKKNADLAYEKAHPHKKHVKVASFVPDDNTFNAEQQVAKAVAKRHAVAVKIKRVVKRGMTIEEVQLLTGMDWSCLRQNPYSNSCMFNNETTVFISDGLVTSVIGPLR